MNQRWIPGGCAVAAIAILIAVAASRPRSEEPVLRARIAGLRAEVAQLRTAQGGASEAPAPSAATTAPWKSPALASRVQARHDPRLQPAGTALQREEKLSQVVTNIGKLKKK